MALEATLLEQRQDLFLEVDRRESRQPALLLGAPLGRRLAQLLEPLRVHGRDLRLDLGGDVLLERLLVAFIDRRLGRIRRAGDEDDQRKNAGQGRHRRLHDRAAGTPSARMRGIPVYRVAGDIA